VLPAYLADVNFNEPPGSSEALEWTTKGLLIAWAVGVGVDAAIPSAVDVGPACSQWLWPAALLGGGALFVGLATASSLTLAVLLIGTHGTVMSAHAYSSNIVAAAAVRPSLRAPTFAFRTAATQVGLLVGSVSGGTLGASRAAGYRGVMALSGGGDRGCRRCRPAVAHAVAQPAEYELFCGRPGALPRQGAGGGRVDRATAHRVSGGWGPFFWFAHV